MLVHASFRLNGKAYDRNSLEKAAQQWQTASDKELQGLGRFITDWLSDDDHLAIHTSGSTGKPKEIHMPKTAMCASAVRTAIFFKVSEGASALLCLPIHYIAGKMMLVRALVLGWHLDIIPPKTKLHIERKYDFTALIPLQAKVSFDLLGQFKTVLIGGAPISSNLRQRISKKYSDCIETYGMTETLTHVATRNIRDNFKQFKTMPGISISTDENDCLVIEVPNLPLSPIVTQDIVKLEGNDTFQLLGRRDWVINSGGIKIFPESLEKTLAPYMKFPFFFTGMPDAKLGEKLVLFAEAPTSKKREIIAIARQHLDSNKYHIPKEVFCIPAFKYNSTSKLDRIASRNDANAN
jgi:O-succinylbenzoic acid--CoA ligase